MPTPPDSHDLSTKRVSGDEALGEVISARAKLAKVQRELAAVTKDRNDLLIEYGDLQRAKYPAPPKPRPRVSAKEDFVRIIVNDVHGSMMDREAVEAFLVDLKEWDPDEVVLNGDIIECGGFLAAHHTLGYVAQTEYTLQDDIAAGNWFLDEIQKAAPRAVIHFIEGNHECLHPSHEVLTSTGWKEVSEVSEKDLVASIDLEGSTVWCNPEATVSYPFDGEMVTLTSRCADAFMTPNHRVAYWGQYGGDLKYRRADSMVGKASAVLPTTGKSPREEFSGVSDNEIRLVAWILTDGHIGGHVGISQSKPATISTIKDLLDVMGVEYRIAVRDRGHREICGVAVKSVKTSNTFCFSTASGRVVARLFGIPNWRHAEKYIKAIPEWVSLLSERQFDIFMDTLILGDGSNASTGHQSRCLYGKRDFLEKIQALCVVNGHRASLAQRNRRGIPDYWALNLSKRGNTKTEGSNYGTQPYKGLVHCITMPTGNFFTRLNGKVHVTGNCRLERWIVDQTMRHSRESEFLRQLIGPQTLLRLNERGVNYYRRGEHQIAGLPPGWIKLGKIFFVHELGGGKNAASAAVGRTAGNVVFAHTHQADESTLVLPGVGLVKAWNPGCMCQRQPLWRHSNPTNWSHGYAVQFVAKSGDFMHINVAVWDGKSLAREMVSRMRG